MQTVDYQSPDATVRPEATRRRGDWTRFAPLFATICGAFAWFKSIQYFDQGQLADEQFQTLLFIGLSILAVIVTMFRLRRYLAKGRWKFIAVLLLCVAVVWADKLAIENLKTATGPKDRILWLL